LPDWEERNLWIRETVPQSVLLENSDFYVNRMRAVMRKYPGVQMIVSQLNHWEGGTDVTGFFKTVLFVPLKRPDTCPSGVDQEGRGCDDWRSNPAGNWPGLFWRLQLIILMGASLLPLLMNLVRSVHYSLRRRGSRPDKRRI
jgi:cobalt-zinc-cadmium resistance protein CzcA